MYIDLQVIYSILVLVVIAFFGFLIHNVMKLTKLINNLNDILVYNTKSINEALDNLPKIIQNIEEVTDNAKDVSDVATDIAADIVVTKESIKSNADIAKDVVGIVRGVFMK